ncbi:N2227-like family protein, putative [Babesia bigemina]|uniref:carnosine N-methyltransferase n=1 Tax=Babesia bigemina TaxID=5866 RepID=A0A061D8S9_BABBI|nr:N2227-like family protein, putative [Babesia bigemina]CDR96948.1 N2227-like family protein, putative [Babesia bigemina]|eukprot:XP_012769134.1 N2227-like family protein, putative [Babesia bigemina]
MDKFSREEREEYQHFVNVVYAFLSYRNDGSIDAERIYRSMQMLSADDRELLIEQPGVRVMKIIHALIKNQSFINTMLSCLSGCNINDEADDYDPMAPDQSPQSSEGGDPDKERLMDNLRKVVRNAPFWQMPKEVADSEIVPTQDQEILSRNAHWVRTTLRQFVRDWSEEGAEEREQAFAPLLESLQRHVPIDNPEKPPRVLCPGCGLGRLPYEAVRLGYDSQGNEFSSFMLIGAYFATNYMTKKNCFKLYPYCLSTSNRVKHEDQMFTCHLPDVAPAEHDMKRDFSMCTGEFTDVYATVETPFDAVLTCFFLDTAKNAIEYIRTCARALRRGGLWANIGPLLYHYADFNHNSVEFSWEELRKIISTWFDFVREEWRDANYTSNKRSMMKTNYKCIYFEAIRNDVEEKKANSTEPFVFVGNVATVGAEERGSGSIPYHVAFHVKNNCAKNDRHGDIIAYVIARGGPRFHWRATAFVDSSTHQAPRHRTGPVFAQRWKYTRVTLLKDTPHVGKAGEVAIVNRNYAFNYLVPFGFARYTTRAELIGIVLDTEYKEALANVRKSSAVHMKARFGNDTVLPFETPAQSDGSNLLVSPLLPIDIIDKMREKKLLLAVDMLREQDIKILTDTGTITEFGVYKVQLNVDPEIDIQITADVKEKPLDTSFLKDVVPSESSQEPPSD